ncbi:MAG: DUF1700 domain-containing protein [Proteobacteria bacterium]|nr:MAG: DUF1700 domain-containing protein [Pseudomonadota bacterium]
MGCIFRIYEQASRRGGQDMTEHEFINQLSSALHSLPAAQRDDILVEYRSHFFEAKEHGKSEEDIANGFGDPKAVARTYVADYHFEQWQKPSEGQGVGRSFSHLTRAVLMIISLLFFNFFFILWPVLAAGFVLLWAWIVVICAGLLSTLIAVLGLIGGVATVLLPNVSTQFAVAFYALGTATLSCLLGFGLYRLSQLAIRGILRYIKLNINLVSA